MITWTEAANEAFEEHMAVITPELPALGIAPAQVAIRLRMSINDQLAGAGLTVAGRAEVSAAIARLSPDFLKDIRQTDQSSEVLGWGAAIAAAIAGVLLPLIALVVEAFTSMSAAEIFDPIPTVWHILAIAFVAFSNGCMTVLLTRQRLDESRWLAAATFCNAIAIGIAAYYAVWFLPIIPFAVIGIIAFGLGLLPLSPLVAMITALALRWKLKKRAATRAAAWPRLWMGFLAGFTGLLAFEAPTVLSHWAATQVARGTADEQQTALWRLRKFGDEAQLLRNCRWERHADSYRMQVLRALFGSCDLRTAQEVYYRVTGRTHNSVPPPSRRANWRNDNREDFRWDEDLGGDAVGERFEELRLKESRLDASLDGDAATGYVEWTMVFRNENSVQQREARALVQLPPGAVVSRLTLWIDGEEREAAFGGRSQVRQAYQAVVQRRRDPLLLSHRGAERVLMQCFPVQPKGGEMKVRIGISLPLVLDTWGEAKTGLPRIIEQNFAEAPGLSHAVWFEARNKLATTAADPRSEQTASGRQAVAFSLSPVQIGVDPVSVSVERAPDLIEVLSADRRDPTRVVRQEFRRTAPGEMLCIVLDGVQGMAPVAEALATALGKLPTETPVRLFLAADRVRECPDRTVALAAGWVQRQEFVGGQDATDALLAASMALSRQGGSILWIHGSQPMVWKSATVLEQNLARSGAALRFLTLAAATGPNELVEKMAAAGAVVVQPRLGQLDADIGRVLRRMREGGIELHRALATDGEKSTLKFVSSGHVVRLWAADEINRLIHGRQEQQAEAVRLAVAMQLVTPVSSAVVLETRAQFDAAGLQPVSADTAPSVPDITQTLWLLSITIAGLFGFARYYKCRAD